MASWDATGRILPIWSRLEGPAKRERLAELSGVRATELSAHNTGKPLGTKVAAKIIAGAAKDGIVISNLELGAPVDEADARGDTLLARLEAIEARIAELPTAQDVKDALDAVLARLPVAAPADIPAVQPKSKASQKRTAP